jgi:hypothetical protein
MRLRLSFWKRWVDQIPWLATMADWPSSFSKQSRSQTYGCVAFREDSQETISDESNDRCGCRLSRKIHQGPRFID